MRKKNFLFVILLLTLLKNVFFYFERSSFVRFVQILDFSSSHFFFLIFSFFKTIAFETLNFEIFTLNLYFFLIMFRLMK